jgi:nucleotide-binding universal stress UspA family protein
MHERSVVVGVDGSLGSRVALEYALDEAARRGVGLRVISAVALPEFWVTPYPGYIPPLPDEIIGATYKATQSYVDDVITARGGAGEVPVTVETRSGRPGEALVEAAAGAELLVIGHRGRGSVASVLLGSVGLYCVLHARCPVTVVRPRPQSASDTARAAEEATTPL